jgi:hypothetical protein
MFQVAQAEIKYFIKFGSFKNLQGLERSVAQLPQDLRSHVVIVRKNSWYVPFAYFTSNKQALYSKLRLYKRYFSDAHIGSSSTMLSYPLVRNYGTQKGSRGVPKRQYIAPTPSYQKSKMHYTPTASYEQTQAYQNVAISEEDNILPSLKTNLVANPYRYQVSPQQVSREIPLITQKVVMKKAEEEDDVFSKKQPKQFKQFSKQMLSGNHYYLAYQKTQSNPSLLIKVTFGNHTVNYQPIIGDMQMTNASYLTEGDRLYMFTDTFMRNGSFSKLEEHRSDHFLVSSWVNGKKLNTLRYYYKLNDAKRYLGLSTSDGLAEVLSEGSYDELFIDE